MIDNVFVTAVLRPDYIKKLVQTIYKYNTHNFKVVVVDQTQDGLPDIEGVHLRLRPNRNLGFAKAMNEGALHALHWKSSFVTFINDDVEFINKRWWDGILETFAMPSEKEIIAVNPESMRVPMWGYGMPPDKYVEIMEYKETYSEEDYDFLLKGDFDHMKEKYDWLPKSFPLKYRGVCDGIAAWGPVFKRKKLEEIGLWDERFYPGGAEDYDMMGRIYSRGYRAVSTRRSWVWHWWGKSKDEQDEAQKKGMPIERDRFWHGLGDLWQSKDNGGHELDVWGFWKDDDGNRHPFKRDPMIGIVEI